MNLYELNKIVAKYKGKTHQNPKEKWDKPT